MNRVKAILVDDEDFNLKSLQLKIEKLFPEIDIIGCYQSPEEAIKAIDINTPDILFLDIQMPRINGFELLSFIKEINFQVIFVTAYNEYAVDALQKQAVGYILKPIDNERLKSTVNRALSKIELNNENEMNTRLVQILSKETSQKNKLIVPTVKGVSFLNQDDILYLEGYEGYTKIHTAGSESLLSSYSLGKFESQLISQFIRCHKSYIVNLSCIKEFENEGFLILTNKMRIPTTRLDKKTLLSLVTQLNL